MASTATPPTVYRTSSGSYVPDSCEPVRAAAEAGHITLVAAGRGTYPGRPLPEHQLPELRSVGFWDVTQRQNWGLGWHRNEGLEIVLLSTGRLVFELSHSTHLLRPGDMTITRPWQRHRLGVPHVTPSRMSWLILDLGVRRPNQSWVWPDWLLLDDTARRHLTHLLRRTDRPVWRSDRGTDLAFARLPHSLEGDEINVARLALAINEILVSLLDMLDREKPEVNGRLASSEHTVEVFIDALSERLDEPWTLDSMAAACGVGRTIFAQYCKGLTNSTPIELLRHKRVAHAASLLETWPGLSITEISFASGFGSTQYFSTLFREERGVSPSEYRRRYLDHGTLRAAT